MTWPPFWSHPLLVLSSLLTLSGHIEVPRINQILFWLRVLSLIVPSTCSIVSPDICIVNTLPYLKFLLKCHFFKEAYADHPILNFSGNTYPPYKHDLSPLFCSTFMSSPGTSHFFTHCLSFTITLSSIILAPQRQGLCFTHRHIPNP